MNCSEACTLASRKLIDSISPEEEEALDTHFGECRVCATWNVVMQVAEAWKEADAGDPTALKLVESSNRYQAGLASGGDRLIIESYPGQTTPEDMDEWFVAQPTEMIFLATRRPNLRKLVRHMESLADQTGSEVVDDSLKRLKEHIRWADDLAVASGVPSETVYPPPTAGWTRES